jgi:hypothetical protein
MIRFVLGSLITIAVLAPRSSGASVTSTATIAGRVVDARSGAPLSFANVVVLGSTQGTLTDSAGGFALGSVPIGSQRIKAMSVGFFPHEAAVTLTAGDSTYVEFALPSYRDIGDRMSDAAAAEVVIGRNVVDGAPAIACSLSPVPGSLRVGRSPEFHVRLFNAGHGRMRLPRILDGSDSERSPRIQMDLAGPEGGLTHRGLLRCGNERSLTASDFVELGPGESFDPFVGGFRLAILDATCFAKPGDYRATFRYSTLDPDVRHWMGDRWNALPPDAQLREILENVPRVEVARTIAFTVTN